MHRVATMLRAALWNGAEGRVRAGVRVGALGATLSVVSIVRGWVPPVVAASWSGFALVLGLSTLAVVALVTVFGRVVDRRPRHSMGLPFRAGALTELALGTLVGLACVQAIGLVEAALGWASYAPRPGTAARLVGAAASAVVFVQVALVEELVFRGYVLRNLAEGLAGAGPEGAARGAWRALVLTSLAFGAAHAGNPHASALAVVNVAVGGVFLGVGAVLRGDLWLAIGLHVGWNLAQNLLGMPVSGQTALADGALAFRTDAGPAWLTGGAFGPEGGLTGLVAMLVGTALVVGGCAWRAGGLRVAVGLGRAPARGDGGLEAHRLAG